MNVVTAMLAVIQSFGLELVFPKTKIFGPAFFEKDNRAVFLQEEEAQEPPLEILQQVAARIIQRAWRQHVLREVFGFAKMLISHCNQMDPQTLLRAVNPREAGLLDAAAGVFIRFRLGGVTFPPNVYYKIFTYRPIVDLCASSPKDYSQLGRKMAVDQKTKRGQALKQGDRSGWYHRMENNTWRLFCCKVWSVNEPAEIGADKRMDFHYSRLQRRQDVGKWRKRKKIEWLKQLYNQGRLRAHSEHRHMAALVESSAQEVMDTIEENGDDELLEWELDELLAWTNTLNFEEYMQEWKHLACSHSSELSNDSPSHSLVFDPCEPADESS
ncbi:protein MFI [Leuresthes tenuis]|uniref:protein MFI n=1 Tax=Leuresthes tenuis TaxID=355514 RepID=UPI003B506E5B